MSHTRNSGSFSFLLRYNQYILSIPSIVGRRGVEQILEIPLADGEREALNASAGQLQEVIRELNLP